MEKNYEKYYIYALLTEGTGKYFSIKMELIT